MEQLNRRDAVRMTAGVGVLAGFGGVAALGVNAADAKELSSPSTDREVVIAAGLTPEEADAWSAAAEAAGRFFALPQLHPMDRQEVATAIHVIQNKLLGRPTYRRYLELAKAARGD